MSVRIALFIDGRSSRIKIAIGTDDDYTRILPVGSCLVDNNGRILYVLGRHDENGETIFACINRQEYLTCTSVRQIAMSHMDGEYVRDAVLYNLDPTLLSHIQGMVNADPNYVQAEIARLKESVGE